MHLRFVASQGDADQAAPAADTITVTLYKNQVATPLTVTLTSSTTQFSGTNASDTAHSFSVLAGDEVAIGITQTTGTPIIRLTVVSRCTP